MMAYVKLVASIMVALFAMGLETEAVGHKSKPVSVYAMCSDMKSLMNNLTSEEVADAEKILAIATTHIDTLGKRRMASGAAGKLKTALAAVVHRSECGESSFDIVSTMFNCDLEFKESFNLLVEATKEYARRCLTPEYIRDQAKSSTSHFESMSAADFINYQFFADCRSESSENEPMWNITITQDRSIKALAKAIIRELKGDAGKLENEKDVYSHLKRGLFAACSNNWYEMTMATMPFSWVSNYVGGYEKVMSSLDEGTQENFSRAKICESFTYDDIKKSVAQKVADQLQSASA